MVKRPYGIVTKDYKLAHFYHAVDEGELYDGIKDTQEMTNAYNDPAYADIVAILHKKLDELRIKYKDSPELDRKYIELNESNG